MVVEHISLGLWILLHVEYTVSLLCIIVDFGAFANLLTGKSNWREEGDFMRVIVGGIHIFSLGLIL